MTTFATRRKLSFFYKIVHPDLIPNSSDHVRKVNTECLSQLNSYIDLFEGNFRSGFISKSIEFFRPVDISAENAVSRPLRKVSVELPSIPPNPSQSDFETAEAKLIDNIKSELYRRERIFRPLEESIELPVSYNSRQKARDIELSGLLYDEILMLDLYKNEKFRALKGLNPYFKRDVCMDKMLEIYDLDESFNISGLNMSCVFFKNDLTDEEKELGMDSIRGHNIDDYDFWDLRGIWNRLHNTLPQIPVLIDKPQTKIRYSQKYGFIQIPCDFKIEDFREFLEENLRDIEKIRRNIDR